MSEILFYKRGLTIACSGAQYAHFKWLALAKLVNSNAPADTERYTWSEISDEEFRRAKPRPHSLEQSIYETTAVIRCAGSAVALKRRRG